jgi:hypothetical protein
MVKYLTYTLDPFSSFRQNRIICYQANRFIRGCFLIIASYATLINIFLYVYSLTAKLELLIF